MCHPQFFRVRIKSLGNADNDRSENVAKKTNLHPLKLCRVLFEPAQFVK